MPILLAIETSSNVGSVCVLRGETAFEEHVRNDTKLSSWAVPAIARVLAKASIKLDEVDAIAFGQGPGSFTGVRTACATAQGIAYASDKPLFAIGTLAALAQAARVSNDQSVNATEAVSVILDARLNEAYCQQFHGDLRGELVTTAEVELKSVTVISLDLKRVVYVGSGAALIAERNGSSADEVEMIRQRTHRAESRWAEGVARLALDQIRRGHPAVAPAAAEPSYVRNRVAQTELERANARAIL